jgi:Protein of unknown function (DUF2905)
MPEIFEALMGNPWSGLGKIIILTGAILVMVGLILVLLPKIPWIGRLPGDLFYKGEKVSFYFPITTCIIISILLTIIFAIFRR